jgi:DNA adenine methylase
MGSKNRIAKNILPIILKNRKQNQFYIELFVGGANLIDKVAGNRIASDNNKYLIAMWNALNNGWQPPKYISKEFYNECREKYNKNTVDENEFHVIGYIGFNGSYGGRFYDGGYAGVIITKEGKVRNYPEEAYKNVIKQVPFLKDVMFIASCYKTMEIPRNSIIYNDIPYKGSKEYKSANNFCHDEYWSWCRKKYLEGHEIYTSEYNAPLDFVCIWEKSVSSSLRANGIIKGDKKSVERLYVYKEQYNENLCKFI